MDNIKKYFKDKSDGIGKFSSSYSFFNLLLVNYVGKLRKAVPSLSRAGDDSRHILINEHQSEKFSKNAIGNVSQQFIVYKCF